MRIGCVERGGERIALTGKCVTEGHRKPFSDEPFRGDQGTGGSSGNLRRELKRRVSGLSGSFEPRDKTDLKRAFGVDWGAAEDEFERYRPANQTG